MARSSANPGATPTAVRQQPTDADVDPVLYRNVKAALASLPTYFRTETQISGVRATDLHTLNTVLGATIEEQVIATLNAMRMVWDEGNAYPLYSFVRQAQTFPDVILRRASDNHILLGIEWKGWYLLAKEGEPNLRFTATRAACAPQDLVVVVPWVLANVLSGAPVVFNPFIELARFAADYRNYYWQVTRATKSDRSLAGRIERERSELSPAKASILAILEELKKLLPQV